MASPYIDGIDWGTQLPPGQVEYFFVHDTASHSTPLGAVPTAFFDPYEIQQIQLALSQVSQFTNLVFHEAGSEAAADIVFMNTSENYMPGILGVAVPPGEPGAGQVLYNYEGTGWDWTSPGTGALEQGGYGFITIIHELGHALGLAHPHDGGGTSTVFPGVAGSGDLGDLNLNQGAFTTMTYNDGWVTGPTGTPAPGEAHGWQGTYMAFDIAALQIKYGANMSYQTGDNMYVIPDANSVGTFYSCIWDAGGNDTMVYQGARGAVIDLRTATLQVGEGAGGWVSYASGVQGGFTIANGVTIENATGGFGADTLVGNNAANILDGRDGADQMTGSGGADRFDFSTKIFRSAINRDTVTDFKPVDDTFAFENAVFKKLGGEGALKNKFFYEGNKAHDGNDRLIYSNKKDVLIYDKNGDDDGGAKIVAVVLGNFHLKAGDILVI